MSITTSPAPGAVVQKPLSMYRSVGWALIALALAIPLIAMALGYIDPKAAGEYTTRGVGSLLVLAAIGWLCTRTMGTRAKANARIMVGVVLGLVVWSSVATHVSDEAAIKVAIRDMLGFEQRQTGKFLELETRLAKLPLGEVLTPTKLASPQGIEYGRAVVAQIRALLAERQTLLQSGVAEGDRLVNNMPTERTRQIARQAMKRELVVGLKYQADLHQTQTRAAVVIEEILDWASARQGTIQAVNGNILFANAADLAEYQALVAKVQAAGDAEEKVTAAAVALRAQKDAEVGQTRAKLSEFLKD